MLELWSTMISSLATHFRVAIEAHSSLLDEVSVSVCRDHLRREPTGQWWRDVAASNRGAGSAGADARHRRTPTHQ